VLSDYHYFVVRRSGTIYDPLEDQEMDTRVFLRLCRSGDNIARRVPPSRLKAL